MFRSLRRATRFLAAGFGAAFRSITVTLPVAAVLAGLTAIGDEAVVKVVEGMAVAGGQGEAQSGMIYTILGWLFIAVLLQIFIGPIFHATAVFVARAGAQGKSAGLYPALNFALNRYKRMFVPHMIAWLAIIIGMQVVIPGILYWMMYAFVDAVAALEDHPDPRKRSRMLTAGRRSSIFWMIFPFIVLQVVRIGLDNTAVSAGTAVWVAYNTLLSVLDFGLATSFGMFYLARIAALDRARARKAAADSGAGEDGAAAVAELSADSAPGATPSSGG